MLKETYFHRLCIGTCFAWSGAITSISFLEAWVKFKAPSLERKVGLDVGRTVFKYFNRFEWILASVLVSELSLWSHYTLPSFTNESTSTRLIFGLGATTVLTLVTQSWVLLPDMNKTAQAIIQDKKPVSPKRSMITHLLYGGGELLKLITLILLGLWW